MREFFDTLTFVCECCDKEVTAKEGDLIGMESTYKNKLYQTNGYFAGHMEDVIFYQEDEWHRDGAMFPKDGLEGIRLLTINHIF